MSNISKNIVKWLKANIETIIIDRDQFPNHELRKESSAQLFERYKKAMNKIRKTEREKKVLELRTQAKTYGFVSKDQRKNNSRLYIPFRSRAFGYLHRL